MKNDQTRFVTANNWPRAIAIGTHPFWWSSHLKKRLQPAWASKVFEVTTAVLLMCGVIRTWASMIDIKSAAYLWLSSSSLPLLALIPTSSALKTSSPLPFVCSIHNNINTPQSQESWNSCSENACPTLDHSREQRESCGTFNFVIYT